MSRACALLMTFAVCFLFAVPARADALDDFLRREMRQRRIPGMAIAVVRDARLVRSAGYGLANVEHDVRVTPDTVFQIQSMTKSFTSAGVLMLVEEGKVGLDDPIEKHLPATPDTWKGITVRHLLTHTSGLKDFINAPTQSLRLDATEEDVLAATAVRPLDFAPGERYAYSNTNYELLGMLIRKLTGMPYGDFLRARIFEPVSMADTRIYSWDAIVPHRAAGYLRDGAGWRNGEYIAPSVLGYPGGGILSTVGDLAKWDIALTNGKVLSPDSRRQMWTPARLNSGAATGYGFGWAMGTIEGHPHQNHTGSHGSGFSSIILRFPSDRLSVIVLCNLGGADTFRIAQGIAGHYVPALAPKDEPAKK